MEVEFEKLKGPKHCLPVWALAMPGLSCALYCCTDARITTTLLSTSESPEDLCLDSTRKVSPLK